MKRSAPIVRKTALARTGFKRQSDATAHSTLKRAGGRKSGLNPGQPHAVPEPIRAAVFARDGGCRCRFTALDAFRAWAATQDDPAMVPYARAVDAARKVICCGKLDPHHIWRRGQGGPDAVWNLAALCRAHHSFVHDSGHGKILGLLRPRPPKGLTVDE